MQQRVQALQGLQLLQVLTLPGHLPEMHCRRFTDITCQPSEDGAVSMSTRVLPTFTVSWTWAGHCTGQIILKVENECPVIGAVR